jgi:RimJ/RimL family protein N-acetyltransferase
MPNMENLARDKDAFHSARLVYRAVQPSDADFLDETMHSDAALFAMADAALLRPQHRKSAEGLVTMMEKALLGVIICLPAADSAAEEGEEEGKGAAETKTDDKQAKATTTTTTTKAKAKPVPIGMMQLSPSPLEMAQHRACSLGVAIAQEHWGKGYGAEAIRWALDWAFVRGNMHRVGLTTAEFNARAHRVYDKLGFVGEGTMREGIWHAGRYWDVKRYGMLEREWRELYGAEWGMEVEQGGGVGL